MESVIYNIDGLNYVVFSIKLPVDCTKQIEEFQERTKNHKGFINSALIDKEVSFWGTESFITIKSLIPENMAIEFATKK